MKMPKSYRRLRAALDRLETSFPDNQDVVEALKCVNDLPSDSIKNPTKNPIKKRTKKA